MSRSCCPTSSAARDQAGEVIERSWCPGAGGRAVCGSSWHVGDGTGAVRCGGDRRSVARRSTGAANGQCAGRAAAGTPAVLVGAGGGCEPRWAPSNGGSGLADGDIAYHVLCVGYALDLLGSEFPHPVHAIAEASPAGWWPASRPSPGSARPGARGPGSTWSARRCAGTYPTVCRADRRPPRRSSGGWCPEQIRGPGCGDRRSATAAGSRSSTASIAPPVARSPSSVCRCPIRSGSSTASWLTRRTCRTSRPTDRTPATCWTWRTPCGWRPGRLVPAVGGGRPRRATPP